MSIIELKQLTFSYGNQEELLFDAVDLSIESTWKLGLMGRNGRGKTTLLKLLMGELPYQGSIRHQLHFGYFPQFIEDDTLLTYYVLEELFPVEQWQIEREFNLLQLDLDLLWRPFNTLSGGEQTKALLALMFIDDSSYPLIDEPTNHLDIKGRKQVANYLKRKKQGFIVVSHDRSFVDEVIDHVLVIEKSQLILERGNFSTYEAQKKLRDEFEQAQNEKLRKEIGRLKQTAREKAEWSRSRETDKTKSSRGFIDTENRRVNKGAIGADAARTMKRSKSIINRMESQISEKETLLKDIETIDTLTINFVPDYHQTILRAENFSLMYDGQLLFDPVSFELNQGERIALVGENGAGKSSVLKFVLGNFSGESVGTLDSHQQLSASYVRQNYETNKGFLIDFCEKEKLDYQLILNNLRKLGIERSVFQNPIEDMSMGQRKKVEIAKSLVAPSNVYFWDEPLNYLDVFNHEQLEEVLNRIQPTMLLVEHDRDFIEKVATKVVELTPITYG